MSLNILNSSIIFNLILIFSFSVSVNNFIETEYMNILFYIFFHITFIYLLFYHYNFYLIILAFIYGLLFDIILINSIGCHLISFLVLIFLFINTKKYLFLLSPYQISFVIFITLNIIIIFELLFAHFLNNIHFNFYQFLSFFIFSLIIFVPSIFILNKLDSF